MPPVSSLLALLLIGSCFGCNAGLELDYLIKSNKTANFSDDPFILRAASLPDNDRFYTTVANGFLGHRIYSSTIYLNGLYNGQKGRSHRARIPGTLPYIDIANTVFRPWDSFGNVKSTYNSLFILDMRNGTYHQMFEIIDKSSGKLLCSVSQRFYAHRLLSRVLVTEIDVELASFGSLTIPLKNSSGEESDDISFKHVTDSSYNEENLNVSCGHTISPEQPGMDPLSVCCASSVFPGRLNVDSSSGFDLHRFIYFSSISTTLNESLLFVNITKNHIKEGTLLSSHEKEWRKTWADGAILLQSGSRMLDTSVVSGLYYLLSAFPSESFDNFPYHFFGASPGGLTNGGRDQYYFGHVFWDQDFWMLGALLPLFPKTVEFGLNYRISRLDAAMIKAKELGFSGALYPWESAYSGLDVCPGEKYILYEQHVTGDIVHTLMQYIYTTGKWSMLLNKVRAFPEYNATTFHTAWDMTYQTAKFWYSRVVWNAEKEGYEIHAVMGPDEYYAPVNNSAFTNVIAAQNLRFAVEAADRLNIHLPEKKKFLDVSENLLVPYDYEYDFHPEFEGFDPKKDIVKQADTILLGFPLMYNSPARSRRNDLKVYSNITDPGGPAMTWSMFSINYNELNELSLADYNFLKQLANIQPPFQIWSEEPDGKGAVNFLTGIGGYLQSILYGYLGLRIYSGHFTIHPRLPPSYQGRASEMTVHGLKVQGATFDVVINKESYFITMTDFDVLTKSSAVILNGSLKFKKGSSASFPLYSSCHVAVASV